MHGHLLIDFFLLFIDSLCISSTRISFINVFFDKLKGSYDFERIDTFVIYFVHLFPYFAYNCSDFIPDLLQLEIAPLDYIPFLYFLGKM